MRISKQTDIGQIVIRSVDDVHISGTVFDKENDEYLSVIADSVLLERGFDWLFAYFELEMRKEGCGE